MRPGPARVRAGSRGLSKMVDRCARYGVHADPLSRQTPSPGRGLAAGLVLDGWIKGLELVLRPGAAVGFEAGCDAPGDGGSGVLTAEGDSVGRDGAVPLGDGEGVAEGAGARLGSGWTGTWPWDGAGMRRAAPAPSASPSPMG